jgi:hypothetical protein
MEEGPRGRLPEKYGGLEFGPMPTWGGFPGRREFWSPETMDVVWKTGQTDDWDNVVGMPRDEFPSYPPDTLRLVFEGECAYQGAWLRFTEPEIHLVCAHVGALPSPELLQLLPTRTFNGVVDQLRRLRGQDPPVWSHDENMALIPVVLHGTYAAGEFHVGVHTAEDVAAQLMVGRFRDGATWNRAILHFLRSQTASENVFQVWERVDARVKAALGDVVARGLWDRQRVQTELQRHPLLVACGRCLLHGGLEAPPSVGLDGVLSCGPAPEIRGVVIAVHLGFPVVELGEGVCAVCLSLCEVTLPETVRAGGARAFEGCVALGGLFCRTSCGRLTRALFTVVRRSAASPYQRV